MCDLEAEDQAPRFLADIDGLDLLVNKAFQPHLRYACEFWATHLIADASLPLDALLARSLSRFCNEKLLCWVESMCLLREFDHLMTVLNELRCMRLVGDCTCLFEP